MHGSGVVSRGAGGAIVTLAASEAARTAAASAMHMPQQGLLLSLLPNKEACTC